MSMIKTENCPICNLKTSLMAKSSFKFQGLYVCKDCVKLLVPNGVTQFNIKKYSLEQLRDMVGASKKSDEEHKFEVSKFNAEKKVGNFIHFDNSNKKFAIPKTSLIGSIKDLSIYDYSEIIDYELLEDGNSISKGGIGRAIVGGILFGGVGAIVGGGTGHKQKKTCSKLQIKITTNNVNNPTIYLSFIESEIKKSSFLYKQVYNLAQEAMSILNIIGTTNETSANTSHNAEQNISQADELLKFKKLLDSGVISKEEFDQKKKQLLDL